MSRHFAFAKIARTITATALLSLPLASVAAAREVCVGDWAEAATIVKRRNMIDMESLTRLAGDKIDGQIMTARFCKDDTTYFYRLVVRRDDGRVHNVRIDAGRSVE